MNTNREINVLIGQVHIGEPNVHLQAILGSCIGIALIDVHMGLCTLSHSLLPSSDTADANRPGRWVNQAIYSAIELLNVAPGRTRKLHAVVAGGGNMLTKAGELRMDIGQSNAQAAFETLKELKIHVVAQDVGGQCGRKISVCADTLDYAIEKIPRANRMEATA